MIKLADNDKYHICSDCGCRFVWNPADIVRVGLNNGIICPGCGLVMFIVVSDIDIVKNDIKGEKIDDEKQ